MLAAVKYDVMSVGEEKSPVRMLHLLANVDTALATNALKPGLVYPCLADCTETKLPVTGGKLLVMCSWTTGMSPETMCALVRYNIDYCGTVLVLCNAI